MPVPAAVMQRISVGETYSTVARQSTPQMYKATRSSRSAPKFWPRMRTCVYPAAGPHKGEMPDTSGARSGENGGNGNEGFLPGGRAKANPLVTVPGPPLNVSIFVSAWLPLSPSDSSGRVTAVMSESLQAQKQGVKTGVEEQAQTTKNARD